MAETRTRERLELAGSELTPRTGLRVRPPRQARALLALLLLASCVVAGLVIVTRVGHRRDVLAVTRTVLAGEQLSDTDLRVVSISADDSFPSVPAAGRAAMVGQYAKFRLVQGSLLVVDSVQPRPLVDPGKVLMSVPVPLSGVPTGLREGSRLVLIVTPKTSGGASPTAPVLVEATVAAVPRNLGELVNGGGSSTTSVALSVEVDPSAAATIGPAEAVAVAVLAPDEAFPTQPAVPAAVPASTSTVPGSVPGVG
jgi:hypothetical protein